MSTTDPYSNAPASDSPTPAAPPPSLLDALSPAPQPDLGPAPPLPNLGPTPQAPRLAAPSDNSSGGSLWRRVVVGALQGLAGSAGSTSFGGGLSQGAAGELNAQAQDQQVKAQQQAAAQAAQKNAVDIAHTQAMTAQIQRQTMNLPENHQQTIIQARAAQTEALRRTGAMIPAGGVDSSPDHHVALQAVTALTQANPGNLYTAEPVQGDDGSTAFQPMQSTDAPLTENVPLLDINGKQIGIIPKGVSGTKATQLQVNALLQGVTDLSSKTQIDQQNANANTTRANAAVTTANAAATNADTKAIGAGNGAFFEGTDQNGNQVAGTADEMQGAGVQHYVKMPALVQTQTLAARELTSPDGLFATARNQILALQSAGKLGPVASRYNNFWAGQGLDGDQQAFRGTLGLIATKLMQAHMGNRGGKDALEHFANLVPENSTPAALMTTLNNEKGYVDSLAKRPAQKGGL